MRHYSWSTAAILAAAGATALASVRAESPLLSGVLSEPAVVTASGDERIGQDIAVFDVTGIPSMDLLGSPNNVVRYLWVGPFNQVTGVGWDVVLQTIAPGSWRGDIRVYITDSVATPINLLGAAPGGADGPGGPTAYSSDGIIKFAPYQLPNIQALGDGLIRLEFYESFEDAPGQLDGEWVSGSLRLQTFWPIPVPAGPGAALGLLSGVLLLRRRSERRCD
ncbi:MAG: hypothetical protein JNK58_03710 [Phycisphaerae bacterium]|nr:hypothetical protein [Phycisphaerae bacterium]